MRKFENNWKEHAGATVMAVVSALEVVFRTYTPDGEGFLEALPTIWKNAAAPRFGPGGFPAQSMTMLVLLWIIACVSHCVYEFIFRKADQRNQS